MFDKTHKKKKKLWKKRKKDAGTGLIEGMKREWGNEA